MRIEFTTETESLEGLVFIKQIIDGAIEHRKAQMAHFAERVKQEWDGVAPKDYALRGENLMSAIAAQGRQSEPGEVVPFRRPGDHATAAAAGAAFGKTNNGAPLGINETTGEFDNDAVAARRAFGGNPTSPPTDAPPAAAGVAASPIAGTSTGTAPVIASSPTTVIAGEADSAGIPWDARIHSEAKTKNNDGSWRYKRKLDEATKTAVLAELKAGGVAQTSNGVPGTPSIPPVPPPPPPPVTLQQPAATAVPLPPPSNVGVPDTARPVVVPINPTSAPPAPPATSATVATVPASSAVTVTASPSKIDFRTLIIKLNKALAAGTITQESLALACLELGIGETPAALGAPQFAHLTDALDAKLFG
jgi:hypothetical protein